MKQEVQASKERKENRAEAITTPAMEGAQWDPRENVDLLALKVTLSLAHQALRGHLVSQDEATMASPDHQGHLDLLDRLLDLTGTHRRSIFLDHRDHLEHLDYLDTPQG